MKTAARRYAVSRNRDKAWAALLKLMKISREQWLITIPIFVGAFVLCFWRSQSERKIQFIFLGYEKDSQGILRAQFEMRNLTARDLDVGTLPFQTNSIAGWKWSGPPTITSQAAMGVPGIWQDSISCPTNNVSWRAVVRARRFSTYQLVVKFGALRLPRYLTSSKTYQRFRDELGGSLCFSDPISPPIEPYLHYKPPERKPEPKSQWE